MEPADLVTKAFRRMDTLAAQGEDTPEYRAAFSEFQGLVDDAHIAVRDVLAVALDDLESDDMSSDAVAHELMTALDAAGLTITQKGELDRVREWAGAYRLQCAAESEALRIAVIGEVRKVGARQTYPAAVAALANIRDLVGGYDA